MFASGAPRSDGASRAEIERAHLHEIRERKDRNKAHFLATVNKQHLNDEEYWARIHAKEDFEIVKKSTNKPIVRRRRYSYVSAK